MTTAAVTFAPCWVLTSCLQGVTFFPEFMPRIAFPLLIACLALASCGVLKKSDVWDTVIRNRPNLAGAADPSMAYAAHLHRVLTAKGVEHRVVTYQFQYTTLLREEAIGERTAVIYRDDTNPATPWWITDDRLSRPVWLPNGTVEKQLNHACRARASIVKLRDFPGSHDGKTVVAPDRRTGFRNGRSEALRPVALGPGPAPSAAGLGDLFERRHGTPFDPASVLDRRKMTALRHEVHLRDID